MWRKTGKYPLLNVAIKSFPYFTAMKFLFIVFSLCIGVFCSAQKNSVSIKELKEETKEDNSFAYALPYARGSSHLLVQAYQSSFSHKGEYALDFKMRKGTKVSAARRGVVVAIKEDSKKGGLKAKYLSEGNHVIIRHDDGTYGNYWHLKYNGALVDVGDTVEQGQVIGLSGNTGYTAFPHLHFEVTTEFTPGQHQIPTRFITRKGKKYLKPLHWYRSV
jgi:murein DD-endopeptidase MepM/ murein hydrolase activator NlpD